MSSRDRDFEGLFKLLFQQHPWHGVSPGEDAPQTVNAYIEIVPTDPIKYELDKASGHLRIDRPHRFSSVCPTLYGFIPQTFCGEQTAALCAQRTELCDIGGDGDPMDICVLTEKLVAQGGFLLRAKPIGGIRMIDGQQADDKIIAVLDCDVAYGHIRELESCPPGVIDRLKHYFLSYKQLPGEAPRKVKIPDVYGRDEALEVIKRSMLDYRTTFGDPEARVAELKRLVGMD